MKLTSGRLLFSIGCFLVLTQSLGADVIPFDDFDDGDDAGWSIVSGTWGVSSGEYHQSALFNGGATPYGLDMITIAGQPVSDAYTIQADSRIVGAYGWAGLLFRYQDTSNYETMLYWSDGDDLFIEYWSFLDASWTLEEYEHVVGDPSVAHTMTLDIEGTNLDVYHDGNFIASFQDTTGLTGGSVGLYTEGIEAFFDNWYFDEVILVEIDVKPGSDPNSINLGSSGVIPVAILTTDTFDASTVDALTVQLDGAEVKVKGRSGNAGALEDVDGDGDLDLVIQVYNETALTEGSTEAVLTGATYGGTPIQGTDSVNIVP